MSILEKNQANIRQHPRIRASSFGGFSACKSIIVIIAASFLVASVSGLPHDLHNTSASANETSSTPTVSPTEQQQLEDNGHEAPEASIFPADLFPSFSAADGVGSGLLILSILLASCAGIGGGGLFIPVFLFVFNYHLSVAHMLSHVMVLTSAIAQTMINFSQRSPDGSRVIKVRTCAVVTPVFLSGHAIGVTIFPMCPDTLVVLLLSFLLGFVSFQTGMKFFEVYKKEKLPPLSVAAEPDLQDRKKNIPMRKSTATMASPSSASSSKPLLKESLLSKDEAVVQGAVVGSGINGEKSIDSPDSSDDSSSTFFRTSPPPTPYFSIFILACVWAILLIVYLIMGSKMEKSVLPHQNVCGVSYWMAFAIGLIFSWILAFFAARSLTISSEGQAYGQKTITRLLVLSAAGGIFAGLVGIGGAQFIVPLLLGIGLNGVAASSTAALAVIVAVSSDFVRAAIDGRMDDIPHLVMWVAALAFLSALCGRSLAVAIAKRFNRMAPIVFSQFLVLSICASLALVSAIMDLKRGERFQFSISKLC